MSECRKVVLEIVSVVSHSVSSKAIGKKLKLEDFKEERRKALEKAILEGSKLNIGERKVVDAYPYILEVQKDDKGLRIIELEPIIAYRLREEIH